MTEPLQETCFVNSNCSSIEGMKRFSHEAMATTFEVMIVHEDERYARQAAIAAFDEVDRLERELSRFRENSDITRINSLPADQPLQLGLDTFECLKIAVQIYAETNGAFDITIGSLLKCWRNEDGTPRRPSPKEINLARLHTGTNLLQLDEAEHTVRLSASGVQIDLGGIGKGYAVDRVAELLREWSVDVALISGGYSSVLALDAPPGKKGWPLTLTNPSGCKEILARPFLKKAALSGSGVQKVGHIIDPRTVQPVVGRRAAWSWRGRPGLASHRHLAGGKNKGKMPSPRKQGQDALATAATADALSTAFMIMGLDEIERYCSLHPETLAMVVLDASSPLGMKNMSLLPERSRRVRFGAWEKLVDTTSD
jgi:thiamine biosynthesis lipoprotein